MSHRTHSLALLTLVACAASSCAPSSHLAKVPPRASASLPAPDVPTTRVVAREELCVSAGRLQEHAPEDPSAGQLRVASGGMRAVMAGDTSSAAELSFTYRGPSAETAPLASGELRRQIGIKLRAQDTCNVVYVMWHVEPLPGIAVSVKRNPGASTHMACRDGGYLNLRPATSSPAPLLRSGEKHTLLAAIDGETLRVSADGAVVWTGLLPRDAFAFDGPAGIRSDNGIFDFELRVPNGEHVARPCPLPVR